MHLNIPITLILGASFIEATVKRMNPIIRLAGIFLFSLWLTGCAGSINGPTQMVTIHTVPNHAKITVDTLPGSSFMTPVSIPLARNRHHLITAMTPGHETLNTHIFPKTDTKAVILDCVWLCIPLIFDVPKGATKKLQPETVTIFFTKKPRLSKREP